MAKCPSRRTNKSVLGQTGNLPAGPKVSVTAGSVIKAGVK